MGLEGRAGDNYRRTACIQDDTADNLLKEQLYLNIISRVWFRMIKVHTLKNIPVERRLVVQIIVAPFRKRNGRVLQSLMPGINCDICHIYSLPFLQSLLLSNERERFHPATLNRAIKSKHSLLRALNNIFLTV